MRGSLVNLNTLNYLNLIHSKLKCLVMENVFTAGENAVDACELGCRAFAVVLLTIPTKQTLKATTGSTKSSVDT